MWPIALIFLLNLVQPWGKQVIAIPWGKKRKMRKRGVSGAALNNPRVVGILSDTVSHKLAQGLNLFSHFLYVG